MAYQVILLLMAAPVAGAELPCASCHPKQAAGFRQTGMGRSMEPGRKAVAGSFQHVASGTRFELREGSLRATRRRLSAEHAPAMAIGSGNHAVGYLIDLAGYLFQAPVSYYAKQGKWGMAPGFEGSPAPDFNRPVPGECLHCHASGARLTPGTLNHYDDPDSITSLTCDRCHGRAESHEQVVNPAKLAVRARDAICEQCHLGGEARVLNPGRTWADFRAGEEMEGAFTVYVSGGDARFKVVGHVEQLALSQCWQKSAGKLWCGTCHDPHGTGRDVSATCRGCHASISGHDGRTGGCAGCHMGKRKAKDSGHAAFTDHWIRRKPESGAVERVELLRAWREPEPALRDRNLGLAYVSAGERDQNLMLLREGYRLLSGLSGKQAEDADVLAAKGLVLFLGNRPGEAALMWERAVVQRPRFGPWYVKLAAAWKAAGNRDRAMRLLGRAIEVDPSIEAAYHALADMKTGVERRRVLERYLQFQSKSLIAREAAP